MTQQTERYDDRTVAIWLLICAATIFGMILLGGVTRLTDSGLSMVDWRPIMGVVPPLSTSDWVALFEEYKLYPEYQQINQTMTLAEFKVIFYYEYLHRMLGRLIGLLFFVPLVVLWFRGRIRPELMPRLLFLLVLGGAQGFMGWYMVQSGLVDQPDVSQYRLTAHLGLAIAIYGLIVWQITSLLSNGRPYRMGAGIGPVYLIGLVYLMILSGGFVAGTDAGEQYPTWPLMGDSFIPMALYADGWMSPFEHPTSIHFNHRMLAYFTALVVVIVAARSLAMSADSRVRIASWLLLLSLACQVLLGISTVLTYVDIIPIAAAHQSGAVLLLTATVFWVHSKQTENLRSDF
jgi:cytochrome c oxidase assembly protein subunit 15